MKVINSKLLQVLITTRITLRLKSLKSQTFRTTVMGLVITQMKGVMEAAATLTKVKEAQMTKVQATRRKKATPYVPSNQRLSSSKA